MNDEPRRSARLSNKRANAESDTTNSGVAQDGLHIVKRKKLEEKANARPRRFPKKGRLRPFLNLPTEIVCEVSSYLHPLDLITMARSCKALRNFFISKVSESAWAASCKGIGLPRCPSDLSEPQYADLLFSKGCYLCNAPRAQIIHFAFRIRVCASCDEKWIDFVDDEDEDYNFYYSEVHKGVRIRPTQSYKDLIPYVEIDPCDIAGCYKHRMFYLPQLEQIREKEQQMDIDEWKAYYEAQVEKTENFMEHAKAVNGWLETEKEMKSLERAEMIRARSSTIKERLLKQGYDAALFTPHLLESEKLEKQWLKLVYDPKPLTARIWSNVEPKLHNILANRQRLYDEVGSSSGVNLGPLPMPMDSDDESISDGGFAGSIYESPLWSFHLAAMYFDMFGDADDDEEDEYAW